MADFYIGEIRAFAFTYVPDGWLACNGQTIPISQYAALAAIVGSSYGPATPTTVVLPNLNGAAGQAGIPMLGAGQGPGLSGYALGQKTGVQTVALSSKTMPPHNHTITAINAGTPPATYSVPTAASHLSRLANSAGSVAYNAYSDQALPTPLSTLAAATLTPFTGGTQPHDNTQPYLAFIYAIAYTGEFPPRPQ